MSKNNLCPNCGSCEFVTDPFQYDVLSFEKGDFITKHSEIIDEYSIYCRECGAEINMKMSEELNKIVLLK